VRILHVLNHVKCSGNGIVDATVDLACVQSALRQDVAVASGGGDYEALLAEHGVAHYLLDQRRPQVRFPEIAAGFALIVGRFRPDVVHAQMRTAVVIARLVRTVARYAIVASIHTHKVKIELLMALADRSIAVSEDVRRTMVAAGFPARKLIVIQNGSLGSVRERSLPSDAIPLFRPAITTIAGMYERKGITELIAAFIVIAPDFPQAHLYIVGDGPDRDAFERQARDTPVGTRIHFEGFQAAPKRWLRSTDVFVLASRAEPSGLVLADARALGCAIVASNVGGIPEVLDGGSAGILVPPKDSAALASAIASLLSDTERRTALARTASQNISRFSVERVARETLVVYRSALGRRFRDGNGVTMQLKD